MDRAVAPKTSGYPRSGSASNQTRPLIELKHVSKTYHTVAGDFSALKDIDLTIENGEFVAIVGKSGSGKTTLINVLTGIDRPSSGEVYIAGTPVHQLDEGQLAVWRGANLGIVFQFFQLLPTLTVLENVRLPMDFCNQYTPSRAQRTRHVLAQAGRD